MRTRRGVLPILGSPYSNLMQRREKEDTESDENVKNNNNNASTSPAIPPRANSDSGNDSSICDELFPGTPSSTEKTSTRTRDNNKIDSNDRNSLSSESEDALQTPDNSRENVDHRLNGNSSNISKNSEERSNEPSSSMFNLTKNARQVNKKGEAKVFKNRITTAKNSMTNSSDKEGEPKDYLERRFEYQKSLDSFDEKALSEQSKQWDGASSVEIALVECCNDDHGELQAGNEAHFLVLLYHYCHSLQDPVVVIQQRALALAIIERTNMHDSRTMSTFLTIGGLSLLDIWLNEARTPVIREKKVLVKKSKPPVTDSNKSKRGRPPKQVEEEEYEIQKEYVTSKTGPLILTILEVLTDIPIRDSKIVMESGLTKDILKLQKTLNSLLQNKKEFDFPLEEKYRKVFVDDLLNDDKYPLSRHPLAGGLSVPTVHKAISSLLSRWKTQLPNQLPIITQKEYFSPILNEIRKGYDAVVAYEKGKRSKPDWLHTIEFESKNVLEKLPYHQAAKNTTAVKQPLQKKLKQGTRTPLTNTKVAKNNFSRINARKRQMELEQDKLDDEDEELKKQKINEQVRQEKERKRLEAEEKKRRLHARLAERKAPIIAAKKKALNAYHSEMDVPLAELNNRKSFVGRSSNDTGASDEEDDASSKIPVAKVVNDDSDVEDDDDVEVDEIINT